jgi:hypothetical protein
VEKYIAFAPSFHEFSYGSELVRHDTAIDAIISIRNALIQITSLLKNRMSTRNSSPGSSAAWQVMEHARSLPGLGAVLSAMKCLRD